MTFTFEKIDHREGGNSKDIIERVVYAFKAGGDRLAVVKRSAEEAASIIDSLDLFQQECCHAVCPGCESVCCINRHAYHEHEDIIYLAALDAEMPQYDIAVPDTAPCQFLGDKGCVISRRLRPHRCNSYFCVPMLEYMNVLPARTYRTFMQDMELLTIKRQEMLEEFRGLLLDNVIRRI